MVKQYVVKRGGRRYGPYFVWVYREGGKLRKVYLRPDQVEQVRALCEESRSLRTERRRTLLLSKTLLSESASIAREVRSVVEGLT